jgi:hypothetical protein
VPTNDLIELIVFEWIRKVPEIMYHVRVRPWICVDADRSRKLILTTANIEDLFGDSYRRVNFVVTHFPEEFCEGLPTNSTQYEKTTLVADLQDQQDTPAA